LVKTSKELHPKIAPASSLITLNTGGVGKDKMSWWLMSSPFTALSYRASRSTEI